MAAPAAELKKAVFALLGADPRLAALTGGRIQEQSAPNATFPSVTFGQTSLYDWSTGSEKRDEQLFTLHAWSRASEKDINEMMGILRALVDGRILELEEGLAAKARLEFSEARYDEELLLHHGLLRFRATAE